MAGFERTRVYPVGEAVREWRWGRFAPLYIAGIAAGIAAGIGIATWPAETPALREHSVSAAPAPVMATIDTSPAFVLPPAPEFQPDLAAAVTTELPFEYYPAMELVLAAPAAVPEQPTAPAAPQTVDATLPAPAPSVPVQAPPPAVEAAVPAAPPAKPNFYVPAVSAAPATGLEIQLLDQINAERAKAGLAPYVLESGLTQIARTRSQQMIDQNYFAHRDPYGYSMYVELLAHFGYSSYAWAGENLAMNNWPAETSVAEAMNGLMNSPTHRANILAGDFTRIGIGEITTSDRRHYFTMIFLS